MGLGSLCFLQGRASSLQTGMSNTQNHFSLRENQAIYASLAMQHCCGLKQTPSYLQQRTPNAVLPCLSASHKSAIHFQEASASTFVKWVGKVPYHWWCALVLACGTPFLPKQSIAFCIDSSAQDSPQVFYDSCRHRYGLSHKAHSPGLCSQR